MIRVGPLSRRRRGFALIDFITGMVIFSAVMVAFVDLTRSKFGLISATEMQTRGLGAAEEVLDRLRVEGLRTEPADGAKRDAFGFRTLRTFVPAKEHGLPAGEGEVAVRSLRMKTGDAHLLYEVRITVSWRDASGRSHLALSTVLPRPGGGK